MAGDKPKKPVPDNRIDRMLADLEEQAGQLRDAGFSMAVVGHRPATDTLPARALVSLAVQGETPEARKLVVGAMAGALIEAGEKLL